MARGRFVDPRSTTDQIAQIESSRSRLYVGLNDRREHEIHGNCLLVVPIRLQVLKNGERDISKASSVVGPDISNVIEHLIIKASRPPRIYRCLVDSRTEILHQYLSTSTFA